MSYRPSLNQTNRGSLLHNNNHSVPPNGNSVHPMNDNPRVRQNPVSSKSPSSNAYNSMAVRRNQSGSNSLSPPDKDIEKDVESDQNREKVNSFYLRMKIKVQYILNSPTLNHQVLRTVLYYGIPLIILLFILQLSYHAYLDNGKSSNYTIVAVTRDFTLSTAKSDRVRYALIHSAIMSWSRLVVGHKILLYSESIESCDHATSLVRGLTCKLIPCVHAEYERPLMSCLINDIYSTATTDVIAFVNGELTISPELTHMVTQANAQYSRYLLLAQSRITSLYPELLSEFSTDKYFSQLFTWSNSDGRKVGTRFRAADLLVFTRNVISLPFPSFLYGLYRWDSYLISQALIEDDVVVVDVTESVIVVEQQNSVSPPLSKVGTAYNDQLVKTLSGNSYKVGSLENCGYKSLGTCPSCTIVVNPNISDVVLFTKRASKEGYLVVLTVNSGYIDLALNWVCWAERIRFKNYILIAEDQLSAGKFKARGCPVIVRNDAPAEKKAADYGSVAFQETMTFRTDFLMTVLTAGFHFVTADMDGLWLDDPIQYFNDHVDLQGQMHKETKISGGFVVVRATSYGRYFWQQVINCQHDNAKFLATHEKGTYEPAKFTEQYCVNELSHGLSSQPLFSRSLLDPWLFPDGKSFFDENNSQNRGIAPALIHNNWIVGTKAKLARLHEWNLHSADEEKEVCLDIPVLPPPTITVSEKLKMKIRIIVTRSIDTNKEVLRLLAQLSAADYADDRVNIEIVVDNSPATTIPNEYAEYIRVLHEFGWVHGDLIVSERTYARGSLTQWSSDWIPGTDNELLVLFDDNAEVSPLYYIWLKDALKHYYLNLSVYDPRLWGISITPASLIVGETHEHRFGDRQVIDVVKSSYYKYQLPSFSGVVLFPQHWRLFSSWLEEFISSHNQPCIPTIISNKWFISDANTHWHLYVHRFVYEKGLYMLYNHFAGPSALALSHSTSVPVPSVATNQSLLVDKNIIPGLVPLHSVPVFDFHMKLVNVPETLSWRQNLSPASKIDQCWTVDMLDAKLKADQEKLEMEKLLKAQKQAGVKKVKTSSTASKNPSASTRAATVPTSSNAAKKITNHSVTSDKKTPKKKDDKKPTGTLSATPIAAQSSISESKNVEQ